MSNRRWSSPEFIRPQENGNHRGNGDGSNEHEKTDPLAALRADLDEAHRIHNGLRLELLAEYRPDGNGTADSAAQTEVKA